MSIEQNEFLQRQLVQTGSLRPIITRYERQAFLILKKVATRFGMYISPKARICDVVSLNDDSKLSPEQCAFASHQWFDFTVTLDASPVLVIEFDGPSSPDGDCADSNRMKRDICDKLELPLLRVDTQYLRTIATFTTLELVIEEILTKFTCEEWRSYSDFHRLRTSNEGADVDLPYFDYGRNNSAERFIGRRIGITTASMLICKIAALELITNSGQLFLTKRMAKSEDGFFTAAALAVLDEDTAILGVGSVFHNARVPIEAMELADALSVIDVLDQIRLFDESRYAGLEMRHALEFLAHFKEYTADEAGSRFLSLNPLCKPLTSRWLKQG